MSLISEALRRQQQEQEGQSAAAPESPAARPEPATPPPAPTTADAKPPRRPIPRLRVDAPPSDTEATPPVEAPPPSRPPSEQKTPPVWLSLLGVTLVLVVLLGALLWLGVASFRQYMQRNVQEQRRAHEVVRQAESAAAAARQAMEMATSRLAEAPESAPTPPASIEPQPPAPAMVPAPVPPPERADPQPVPTPVPALSPPLAPQPVPPPPPIPVRAAPVAWPRLELTGLVGGRGSGAAIINGQIVGVGEVIEDVLVLELVKGGARLEFGGEERFLRVGASLP